MNGKIEQFWDLNNEDIQSCIELACDGVTAHLNNLSIEDESDLELSEHKTAELIHKVMYAITDAAQNNLMVANQLESKQDCKFRLHLQVL